LVRKKRKSAAAENTRKGSLNGNVQVSFCCPLVICSLVETAKANGLKPYFCLRYLFERLPLAETEEDYRKLLPMNLTPEQIALPAA